MTNDPPFDPPYLTVHGTGADAYCVETLADGTTRPAPLPKPIVRSEAAPLASSSARSPAPKGNQRAFMYLNVPFADKDSAKKLGAKWDAEKKKWYVPHGVDVSGFKQWWPSELADKP